ncbi:MAG: Hpt domain-containing protein [Pseudomonadota bacterium]
MALPLIDDARIKELEADFGADDLAEIIEAFLEEASEAVDSLGAVLGDGPNQSRVELFHFLSGAARNLGATRFAALCRQLENENPDFGDADYMAFRAEYQAICDHFGSADGGLAATA